MAKRFTDTDKWNKRFIRSLKAPYKLLWLFICDECSHSGIWDVDLEVAELKLGVKISLKDALKYFSSKIIEIDNGNKWIIPSFIEFQYGELSETNRAHTKIILQLRRYNIVDEALKIKPLSKPLISPLQGAKEEEEDKEGDIVTTGVSKIPPEPHQEKYLNVEFQGFEKWIKENAERVAKMQTPFRELEYEQLKKDFTHDQICELLKAMHNHKELLSKNVSAYLTFLNWAKRRDWVKQPAPTQTNTPLATAERLAKYGND